MPRKGPTYSRRALEVSTSSYKTGNVTCVWCDFENTKLASVALRPVDSWLIVFVFSRKYLDQIATRWNLIRLESETVFSNTFIIIGC